MKEIKAYVRRDEINVVVEQLRRAGAPGVAVIEIHPVGYGYEANPFEPHGASACIRSPCRGGSATRSASRARRATAGTAEPAQAEGAA